MATVPSAVRLAMSIRIPHKHQVVAKVMCDLLGLLALKNNHKVLEHHMTMMENGILDKIVNQTLQVCLGYFSNHTVKLINNTFMGLTSPALNSTFTLTPQTLSGELYPKERGIETNRGRRETNKASNRQNGTISERKFQLERGFKH